MIDTFGLYVMQRRLRLLSEKMLLLFNFPVSVYGLVDASDMMPIIPRHAFCTIK